MNPTLRSIALKFVYAFLAAEALAISGWIEANPIGAWTLVSFKVAVGTAAFAALKKFIASFLTPS